jgi:CheY-like chemotaxis protein
MARRLVGFKLSIGLRKKLGAACRSGIGSAECTGKLHRAGTIRILVVDDDPAIRLFVERVLAGEGHDVVLAANGLEAMELYARSTFSLIITDLVMPRADGLELLRRLRKEPSAPKIIAMSGGSGRGAGGQYLGLAELLGAVTTLHKPFTVAELTAAVKDVNA